MVYLVPVHVNDALVLQTIHLGSCSEMCRWETNPSAQDQSWLGWRYAARTVGMMRFLVLSKVILGWPLQHGFCEYFSC